MFLRRDDKMHQNFLVYCGMLRLRNVKVKNAKDV